MPRIHLFEFEDLSWFPKIIRDYMTDFLQFLSNKTKMYKPVVPLITAALEKSNTNQIIDLGSGGGGGLLWLNQELKQSKPNLKITLTDFYPNTTAFEHTKMQADNFEYIKESIDARNVPANLKGLRTQFLSLHHFKEKDAKKILQNAIDSENSIAIFEGQERSFLNVIAMMFSPITVLLTTPLIKPFKFGRIIFTYFIPLVPLFSFWDGVVSALRTYSVKEMNQLVDSLEKKDSFDWEIGKVKSGPSVIMYLIGTKK